MVFRNWNERAGRFFSVAIVLVVSLAVTVYAQGNTLYGFDPETRIYIVQPGDTMWDISNKAYSDPWKWPRIWENNPEVSNPHDIYPDGQLVLPHTDGLQPVAAQVSKPVEEVALPVPEPVVEDEPVVAEAKPEPEPVLVEPEDQNGAEILKDYGEIAEESRIKLQAKPKQKKSVRTVVLKQGAEGVFAKEEKRSKIAILGGEQGRTIFAKHDRIYLSKGKNADIKKGQRFFTYKKHQRIEHPDTDEDLGVYLQTSGIIEVVEVSKNSSTAIVLDSFGLIEASQYLAEYKAKNNTVVPVYSDEASKGKIIQTLNNLNIVASYQVLYIDLGTRDGLEQGAMLDITRSQVDRYDRVNDVDVELPVLKLGLGVVLDVNEKASTVLVVKSVSQIEVGDSVETITEDS